MEFYFGKVDAQDLEYVDDSYFKHGDNYYYYKLETNDEGFVLKDTCDRYVPMHKEVFSDLATIAFLLTKYYTAHIEAEQLLNKRLDQLQQLAEFWENNP